MKNKLTIHYIIGIAAVLVVFCAFYLLYQEPQKTKSLILTIVGCAVVAVGQFIIIKQKKKSANK